MPAKHSLDMKKIVQLILGRKGTQQEVSYLLNFGKVKITLMNEVIKFDREILQIN